MLGERRQSGGTSLLGRIDRQEIVVPAHELGDPILVLGPQNGAGDIDDAPAPLEETQRAFECLILILNALFERAGTDAPLGVGVTPPGAGAGARRVDQHQIAPPFEVAEDVRLPSRRPHLDIARAGSCQPGEDRREALASESAA